MAAYQSLTELSKEIALLSSTASVLGWDQETFLPPKGVAYRADQMAQLSGMVHRKATSTEFGELISKCEDEQPADGSPQAANVREWRWNYDRDTKLPSEFVEGFQKAKSLAMQAWQAARKDNDFDAFRPHLEKVIQFNREKADHWGYETCRYDALLDTYERGVTTTQLTATFDELKQELVGIAAAAHEKSKSIPADRLIGHYPISAQKQFNQEVAAAFGFDFEAGRIDTTTHPFCTGLGPADTRLTTRYDESDFTSSLYGVMHECGHGLYDQNLPAEFHGTPVGNAVSLGIHESQSRLWENHVGRKPEFWMHWFDRAAEIFPPLRKLDAAQVAESITRTQPSFIRVEADEVTYDLHVLLRFEIEKKLIAGDLEASDVPAAWNELCENLLGLKVEKHTDGCLQDIHWSMGAIGYFPTYTLGNLNAALLYKQALAEKPEIPKELAGGEYTTLLDWMKQHVHHPGSQHLPKDLLKNATGSDLNAKAHLEHLKTTYT
ncbi:MAG: carboxypeptidase Taq [Verrucomicrobiales bacterium]|jgi:carboxypeptidase Taq